MHVARRGAVGNIGLIAAAGVHQVDIRLTFAGACKGDQLTVRLEDRLFIAVSGRQLKESGCSIFNSGSVNLVHSTSVEPGE